MTRGVVAGKFHPFHLGHVHLIESALADVDHVDVLVCEALARRLPARLAQRGSTPHSQIVPSQPTSSTGPASTRATPLCVPGSQSTPSTAGPMCASRASPTGRPGRITSAAGISASIPAARRCPCRELRSEPTCSRTSSCSPPPHAPASVAAFVSSAPRARDFARIIERQHAHEDEPAGIANKILVCDTDAFTTCVFHEAYLGTPAPPHLEAQLRTYGTPRLRAGGGRRAYCEPDRADDLAGHCPARPGVRGFRRRVRCRRRCAVAAVHRC